MPHVDIKVNPEKCKPERVAEIMEAVAKIVGKGFGEDPDYVSVEVVPQGAYKLNRKDIDIEVNSAPGVDPKRVPLSEGVAQELCSFVKNWMEGAGISGSVSAYVRIFEAAPYALEFTSE